MSARVGVLALQGAFERHQEALESLGVTAVRVSLPEHLENLEALVLPGGESTTMSRLLAATGLRAPVEAFVARKPVLGTCAGVILLGKDATGLPAPPLGMLDVDVERNAYGRQIDSFEEEIEAPVVGGTVPAVFIRAPRIRRVGEGVEVIARRRDGEPVGVRSGHVVGLCFHPELTSDRRLHRWFLREVAGLPVDAGAGDAASPPEAAAGGMRP